MKKVILMAMVLSSAMSAFAIGNGDIGSVGGNNILLKETVIANCVVAEDNTKLQILSSDNGEERIVTFKYQSGGRKMSFSVGDNLILPQKLGQSKLFAGLDEKSDYGAAYMMETPAAIYLSRTGADKLSGKITIANIIESDFICKTMAK